MTLHPVAMHIRRACQPVAVSYNQPTASGTFPGTGTLVAEVWDRGKLHHFRISLGCCLLLVPPHWLALSSYQAVRQAGLTVPEGVQAPEQRAMESVR